MNKSETNVTDYINNMITYLQGDLIEFKKLCKEIEQKENSNEQSLSPNSTPILNKPIILSRMTIPIAITLFSVIDVLGYLVGKHRCERDTHKNFKAFFLIYEKLGEDEEIEFVGDERIDILNFIFRQGLVHVYFPKLRTGISYHSKLNSSPLFFKDESADLILNVNKLENIVTKTMNEIQKFSIGNNEMDTKYFNMIKKYEREDGEKIKKLSTNILSISKTKITTQTTAG